MKGLAPSLISALAGAVAIYGHTKSLGAVLAFVNGYLAVAWLIIGRDE